VGDFIMAALHSGLANDTFSNDTFSNFDDRQTPRKPATATAIGLPGRARLTSW